MMLNYLYEYEYRRRALGATIAGADLYTATIFMQQHVWTSLSSMTGPSPGLHNAGSSSLSNQDLPGHATAEDIEDYEQADLSLENALLADDPLEDNGKAPYGSLFFFLNMGTDSL